MTISKIDNTTKNNNNYDSNVKFRSKGNRYIGGLSGHVESTINVNGSLVKFSLHGEYKVHSDPAKQFPYIDAVKECDYPIVGGILESNYVDSNGRLLKEFSQSGMDMFFPYTKDGIVEFLNKSFSTNFSTIEIESKD